MLAVTLPFWLDRPADEAFSVAAAAAAAGIDHLWVGEMATFDAPSLAAAIVTRERFKSVTLGPLPITTRDPVAMAMAGATVRAAAAAAGHDTVVNLALGASTPTVTARWHGVVARPTEARWRDTVAIVRALVAGERTAHVGTAVTSHGFTLRAGLPGTRLVMAAFGPRTLALAAELADVVVVNQVTVEHTRRTRVLLDELAAARGEAAPELAVWMAAAADATEGFEQVARGLSLYVPQPGYGEMFAAAGFGSVVTAARAAGHAKAVRALIPDELVHAVAAIGVSESVRRVREHVVAGATIVCVAPATAGDTGAERLLRGLAVGLAP